MPFLRHRFIALLSLGLAATAAVFFLIVRGGSFGVGDVALALRAPDELDVGSETEVIASLTNSGSSSIRDGRLELRLPEGIELVASEGETFAELPSRAEQAARFRIRATGMPETALEIIARASFRPQKISAVFTKEERKTVRLRELPFDVSFSFPSDASNARPMTFFIRFSSRAGAPIGPVGLALDAPEQFTVFRTRPTAEGAASLWDFGMLEPGAREEIAVTGAFDAAADGGAFLARVGILDASRRSLRSFRELREYLNLRAGAVSVDLSVGGEENPREAVVVPGETIAVEIRYTNRMSASVEDLSIVLAFAHQAISQKRVTASEPFTRSISGEYVWGSDEVAALRQLVPGVSGTIGLSAVLDAAIPLKSFGEANQTIIARARAVSGGQILGERQATLKISGTLAVSAEVRHYGVSGGSNRGPIPPKVGEETTYTATLSVTSGTTGLQDVAVRTVLGPSVRFLEVLDPESAVVVYDETTRELLWTIGDLPPGAGSLSVPQLLAFRIALTPLPADAGHTAELLSAILATGADTFIGRTLDGSAPPVDTSLPDDPEVRGPGSIVVS